MMFQMDVVERYAKEVATAEFVVIDRLLMMMMMMAMAMVPQERQSVPELPVWSTPISRESAIEDSPEPDTWNNIELVASPRYLEFARRHCDLPTSLMSLNGQRQLPHE